MVSEGDRSGELYKDQYLLSEIALHKGEMGI